METRAPHVVSLIENKQEASTTSIIHWTYIHGKSILAELVSTMLLIVCGCMACIPLDGFVSQSPLYGPLGFGLVAMFNIQTFGHISGAHMNPAVTSASMVCGFTSIPLGITYFSAQCTGSILGYGMLLAISPVDVVSEEICLTLPHVKQNLLHALGVEIILTAALAFVNCGGWNSINKHNRDSVPLKIGFAVVGLSIAGGPLTGASMNPARSLGPALWTGKWGAHWIYWIGPLVGGTLAAVVYKFIWLSEKTECKIIDNERLCSSSIDDVQLRA